jgi:hypothetical protein
MDVLTALLVIVKIAVLVLGSIVAVLAYRGYKRTEMAGLLYFAAGLSIITIGTVLVGFFHHIIGVATTVGMLLESLIIGAGFVVMIVGLYGQ